MICELLDKKKNTNEFTFHKYKISTVDCRRLFMCLLVSGIMYQWFYEWRELEKLGNGEQADKRFPSGGAFCLWGNDRAFPFGRKCVGVGRRVFGALPCPAYDGGQPEQDGVRACLEVPERIIRCVFTGCRRFCNVLIIGIYLIHLHTPSARCASVKGEVSIYHPPSPHFHAFFVHT